MTDFKVWKTLPHNKPSGKTPTGLKLGRLLDCRVADISNIANYVYSIPGLVPRGSCGGGYARTKDFLADYETK